LSCIFIILFLLLSFVKHAQIEACHYFEYLHPTRILADQLHDHIRVHSEHFELIAEHNILL